MYFTFDILSTISFLFYNIFKFMTVVVVVYSPKKKILRPKLVSFHEA